MTSSDLKWPQVNSSSLRWSWRSDFLFLSQWLCNLFIHSFLISNDLRGRRSSSHTLRSLTNIKEQCRSWTKPAGGVSISKVWFEVIFKLLPLMTSEATKNDNKPSCDHIRLQDDLKWPQNVCLLLWGQKSILKRHLVVILSIKLTSNDLKNYLFTLASIDLRGHWGQKSFDNNAILWPYLASRRPQIVCLLWPLITSEANNAKT